VRRRLAAVAVAGLVALAAAPAGAIELHLLGQPLRIDITESLFTAYHGDLGYLIVERDNKGTPLPQNHFFAITNRLNVDVAWRRWRLAVRFDTGIYAGEPDHFTNRAGMMVPLHWCGPPKTVTITERSNFCGLAPDGGWPAENYFWPEKAALEYAGRTVEATLGDFYISIGRGLVLSLRKLDELGIDTTLLGGRFVYHEDNVRALLAAGATNIQNIDEATGRFAPDPFDLIAAARVEYRAFDRALIGVHAVAGRQNRDVATAPHVRHDGMFMFGGTLDAPRLLPWLALYFEGAGQVASTALPVGRDPKTAVFNETAADNQTGYALYGNAIGYFGPVSLLLEVKHYVHFQRWTPTVDQSLPEFAPLVYNQPPTAERLETEILSSIYDVTGPRLRVDWRINPWVLVYTSYAYFEDRGTQGAPKAAGDRSGVIYYHDPYAGAELRWNGGRSHFFPSGGYRVELCG
jgi:hypothetical protein